MQVLCSYRPVPARAARRGPGGPGGSPGAQLCATNPRPTRPIRRHQGARRRQRPDQPSGYRHRELCNGVHYQVAYPSIPDRVQCLLLSSRTPRCVQNYPRKRGRPSQSAPETTLLNNRTCYTAPGPSNFTCATPPQGSTIASGVTWPTPTLFVVPQRWSCRVCVLVTMFDTSYAIHTGGSHVP